GRTPSSQSNTSVAKDPKATRASQQAKPNVRIANEAASTAVEPQARLRQSPHPQHPSTQAKPNVRKANEAASTAVSPPARLGAQTVGQGEEAEFTSDDE